MAELGFKPRSLGPWLMWLCGLSSGLQTERSLVPFPVRAHAWVAGQVLGWVSVRGNRSMFPLRIEVSFLLFLPPFPSLSKNINKLLKNKNMSPGHLTWKALYLTTRKAYLLAGPPWFCILGATEGSDLLAVRVC